MNTAMEEAVTGREYLLGDTPTMADVVFGGTLRFMLMFKMVAPRPSFNAYAERLGARPALKRGGDQREVLRRSRPEDALAA